MNSNNIEFHCEDVLEHIKRQADCSVHTTFCDPPYFLGTEWYQDANNRWQMKGTGSDFMGAWGVQNADWWREYFKELHRIMKFGGYVVMYSITQQSDMVSGLLREAGFEKCAENGSGSLHWANISNFPKASDCAVAIEKRNGSYKKEMVATRKGNKIVENNTTYSTNTHAGFRNIAKSTNELSELLNGYKYGKAPLKKITEPILVFRKAPKNGSVLNDLMQCQSDPEISPAILDIEGNRVGLSEADKEFTIARAGYKDGVDHVCLKDTSLNFATKFKQIPEKESTLDHVNKGRYPCTLFISPAAAEFIDMQLDVVTFELNGVIHTKKRLEMESMIIASVVNRTFKYAKEIAVKRESLHSGDIKAHHKVNRELDANGNYQSPNGVYGKYTKLCETLCKILC